MVYAPPSIAGSASSPRMRSSPRCGVARSPEALEDDEITRVHSLLAMIFLAFENFFEQSRLGAVTRNTLEVSRPDLLDLLSRPVAQAWWKRYGPRMLTPEFRAAIDALVSRSESHATTQTAAPFDRAGPPA